MASGDNLKMPLLSVKTGKGRPSFFDLANLRRRSRSARLPHVDREAHYFPEDCHYISRIGEMGLARLQAAEHLARRYSTGMADSWTDPVGRRRLRSPKYRMHKDSIDPHLLKPFTDNIPEYTEKYFLEDIDKKRCITISSDQPRHFGHLCGREGARLVNINIRGFMDPRTRTRATEHTILRTRERAAREAMRRDQEVKKKGRIYMYTPGFRKQHILGLAAEKRVLKKKLPRKLARIPHKEFEHLDQPYWKHHRRRNAETIWYYEEFESERKELWRQTLKKPAAIEAQLLSESSTSEITSYYSDFSVEESDLESIESLDREDQEPWEMGVDKKKLHVELRQQRESWKLAAKGTDQSFEGVHWKQRFQGTKVKGKKFEAVQFNQDQQRQIDFIESRRKTREKHEADRVFDLKSLAVIPDIRAPDPMRRVRRKLQKWCEERGIELSELPQISRADFEILQNQLNKWSERDKRKSGLVAKKGKQAKGDGLKLFTQKLAKIAMLDEKYGGDNLKNKLLDLYLDWEMQEQEARLSKLSENSDEIAYLGKRGEREKIVRQKSYPECPTEVEKEKMRQQKLQDAGAPVRKAYSASNIGDAVSGIGKPLFERRKGIVGDSIFKETILTGLGLKEDVPEEEWRQIVWESLGLEGRWDDDLLELSPEDFEAEEKYKERMLTLSTLREKVFEEGGGKNQFKEESEDYEKMEKIALSELGQDVKVNEGKRTGMLSAVISTDLTKPVDLKKRLPLDNRETGKEKWKAGSAELDEKGWSDEFELQERVLDEPLMVPEVSKIVEKVQSDQELSDFDSDKMLTGFFTEKKPRELIKKAVYSEPALGEKNQGMQRRQYEMDVSAKDILDVEQSGTHLADLTLKGEIDMAKQILFTRSAQDVLKTSAGDLPMEREYQETEGNGELGEEFETLKEEEKVQREKSGRMGRTQIVFGKPNLYSTPVKKSVNKEKKTFEQKVWERLGMEGTVNEYLLTEKVIIGLGLGSKPVITSMGKKKEVEYRFMQEEGDAEKMEETLDSDEEKGLELKIEQLFKSNQVITYLAQRRFASVYQKKDDLHLQAMQRLKHKMEKKAAVDKHHADRTVAVQMKGLMVKEAERVSIEANISVPQLEDSEKSAEKRELSEEEKGKMRETVEASLTDTRSVEKMSKHDKIAKQKHAKRRMRETVELLRKGGFLKAAKLPQVPSQKNEDRILPRLIMLCENERIEAQLIGISSPSQELENDDLWTPLQPIPDKVGTADKNAEKALAEKHVESVVDHSELTKLNFGSKKSMKPLVDESKFVVYTFVCSKCSAIVHIRKMKDRLEQYFQSKVVHFCTFIHPADLQIRKMSKHKTHIEFFDEKTKCQSIKSLQELIDEEVQRIMFGAEEIKTGVDEPIPESIPDTGDLKSEDAKHIKKQRLTLKLKLPLLMQPFAKHIFKAKIDRGETDDQIADIESDVELSHKETEGEELLEEAVGKPTTSKETLSGGKLIEDEMTEIVSPVIKVTSSQVERINEDSAIDEEQKKKDISEELSTTPSTQMVFLLPKKPASTASFEKKSTTSVRKSILNIKEQRSASFVSAASCASRGSKRSLHKGKMKKKVVLVGKMLSAEKVLAKKFISGEKPVSTDVVTPKPEEPLEVPAKEVDTKPSTVKPEKKLYHREKKVKIGRFRSKLRALPTLRRKQHKRAVKTDSWKMLHIALKMINIGIAKKRRRSSEWSVLNAGLFRTPEELAHIKEEMEKAQTVLKKELDKKKILTKAFGKTYVKGEDDSWILVGNNQQLKKDLDGNLWILGPKGVWEQVSEGFLLVDALGRVYSWDSKKQCWIKTVKTPVPIVPSKVGPVRPSDRTKVDNEVSSSLSSSEEKLSYPITSPTTEVPPDSADTKHPSAKAVKADEVEFKQEPAHEVGIVKELGRMARRKLRRKIKKAKLMAQTSSPPIVESEVTEDVHPEEAEVTMHPEELPEFVPVEVELPTEPILQCYPLKIKKKVGIKFFLTDMAETPRQSADLEVPSVEPEITESVATYEYFDSEESKIPKRKETSIIGFGRLALSQKACRFQLPVDMHKFETMTPIEYIRDFTVITSRRKFIYQKTFAKFKDNKTGFMSAKDLEKGLKDVLVNSLTADQFSEIKNLLQLEDDMKVDSHLFHCIAAVSERILYPRFITEDTADMPEFQKDTVEVADFCSLKWKLHGVNCDPSVRSLLEVLSA